uniref:SAM-dependent methyltransferase TRM5/TYW2-type domain-containing protein n=1 Tax=Chromera velia CCMP2878 TaxID=1169474 RepID=A0A0G4HNZ4_9ALVE|eukprot:Cvel_1203.t1-p1 / transcript=Cvel_1203.t1 / gene=Cvel_1203 / organism=Chromera_velia_CCMP2878 / gene_product=tRNA (guanine(37)-N1)-methyltransferase Trm5b, putative / transcript_product=tRNA (guanine(37)-N1)-methyltransferase Trm5b, putative / location=Cvel_scaffold40:34988-35963(-) / protein_length=294 / sequence_SO=supercontig / SO=protein_coding / is_pseudo=false
MKGRKLACCFLFCLPPLRRFSTVGFSLRPSSYDIIGDIALIKTPDMGAPIRDIGEQVMASNRKIKVCAVKTAPMEGPFRQSQVHVIAGEDRLETTHKEWGVKTKVHLGKVFFSVRMSAERKRVCDLVQPKEKILVLFAGCGPQSCMLCKLTEVSRVVAVEKNPDAIACLKMSRDANKLGPDRLRIVQQDVREFKTLETFDRILIPRPKGEGSFLDCALPFAEPRGAWIHWYDFSEPGGESGGFVSSRKEVEDGCMDSGFQCRVERIVKASKTSIGKRKYRLCVDAFVWKEDESI